MVVLRLEENRAPGFLCGFAHFEVGVAAERLLQGIQRFGSPSSASS